MEDLSYLLDPISDTAPCGTFIESDEDLEKRFVQLEQLLNPTSESIFEDDETPAVEDNVSWRSVLDLCLELLYITRDLRLLVIMVRAMTHLYGLEGTAKGTAILLHYFDEYWEAVHPQVHHGEEDEAWRITCLQEMTATPLPLECPTLPIIPSLEGPWLDIALLMGGMDDGKQQAAFRQLALEQTETDWRQWLEESLAQLIQIEASANRVAIGDKLDLSGWTESLQQLHHLLIGDVPDQSGDETGDASMPTNGSFLIRSREEALVALDAISHYFTTHEPTSPVPLIVDRAKKLANMNFLSILQDISPESRASLDLMEQAEYEDD